ncbi:MAG TPA: sugar ABC transporter permease [Burkholderiales bacterium]|nr:sugar ABC transporter permease [Burkholderiales bacterium]
MRLEREQPWRYLAPAGLLLALVTVYPLAHVLWLSLERRSLLDPAPPAFAGLENYARLAADERFWNALGNTAYFVGVSVSLELMLGLAFALALQRAFRGRAALYGIILLPWAVPTAVSARMWEWMFEPDIGVLNYLLGAQVNWLGSPAWALNAAVLMDVWKSTPFVALLLIAGLQSIPQDLYRAAAVDGASRWTVLTRITLPLLAPMILVALLFRTIDAFRVFDAIYVLTGGGPADSTETLSIYAYRVLFQSLEFGYGSALAVSVFALVAVFALVYRMLLRKVLP